MAGSSAKGASRPTLSFTQLYANGIAPVALQLAPQRLQGLPFQRHDVTKLGGQRSGDFFSSNANRIVNCKEKNLIKTQNTTFTLFFFVFFWGLAVEPVNCSNS